MLSENEDTITINLILDQSAFVRGIGNIKRWFNHNQQTNHSKPVNLTVFIPSYTLHELDFVKKGISMLATNARESIRFIDKITSEFDEIDQDYHNQTNINYRILLETPDESGPSWSDCTKFKTRSPKIKEFPNYKTKFDSNLIGHTPASNNMNNDNIDEHHSANIKRQINDIQYENSSSYQQASDNSNKKAEMPQRLKYLIRTCIYKEFIEKGSDWKLVTEDSITKIWLSSFNIDCVNINEAELLIVGLQSSIGQIDTSTYDYTSINDSGNRRRNKSKKKMSSNETSCADETLKSGDFRYNPKKGPRNDSRNDSKTEVKPNLDINGNVRREKFQAISYAPRGNGKLWTP